MTIGLVVLSLRWSSPWARAVGAAPDGRFRGTHASGARATRSAGASPASVLDGSPWEGQLGERATLLQFSSAFCAPCRATRRVLSDVAGIVPGVAHVEVDAEHHLDVVRRLGILRTPTTLVLDAHGPEVARAVRGADEGAGLRRARPRSLTPGTLSAFEEAGHLLDVGVDHQLGQSDRRSSAPSSRVLAVRLGRVADQRVDLGRAVVAARRR